MSTTPREIGTLIVVVLKANHLPNKRHIGKQDPYCLVTVDGEKKRTKAIKRGGQHPEWDEELRFTLYEDDDDLLARTAHGDGTPPPLPPKESKGPKKIRGGNNMRLACFADDPREPDLIGDTDVDLTEVLTKGETDEWFTLSNKDKFAGKVYLELTFWSNEPPPEKKVTPKPPRINNQYGGPGSFVPSGDSNGVYNHSRPPSDTITVPSSLRASNSLAKLDLYVPPYEYTGAAMDKTANEFNDLGISEHRRRESFPPVHTSQGYAPQLNNPYVGDTYYDPNQLTYPSRAPRQSMPVSSSGFVPVNSQSTFSSHSMDTFYPPSLSHTPAPASYTPTFYPPPTNYMPPPTPAPLSLPHNTGSYIPSPYHAPQTFPSHQIQTYVPYPASTPVPTQQYPAAQVSTPPLNSDGQTNQNGNSPYSTYQPTPSPSHEPIPTSIPTSSATNSRPLPPQPLIYTPPSQDGLPPPVNLPPPPPPPLPSLQYNQVPPPPPPPAQSHLYPINVGPPPPPPPPLAPSQVASRRRTSLPVPPVVYSTQLLSYQPPPPPPPPLPTSESYPGALPPPPPPQIPQGDPQTYSPGPPPKPPVQTPDNSQWYPMGATQGYYT